MRQNKNYPSKTKDRFDWDNVGGIDAPSVNADAVARAAFQISFIQSRERETLITCEEGNKGGKKSIYGSLQLTDRFENKSDRRSG